MRSLITLLFFASPVTALAQDPAVEDPVRDELRAREATLLERVLAFDPERHEQLRALERTDPRAYLQAMWRVRRALEGGTTSPEMKAGVDHLRAIHGRYPSGLDGLSPAEASQVRAEISSVARRMFELRQLERRRRIAELRTTLTELEAELARRDDERESRIRAFVDRFFEGPLDL